MPLVPRFFCWLLICAASGAPSFFFGAMAYEEPADLLAMLLGILTFAVGYTWVTGTARFERLRRKAFVNRTLKIGFGTRIGLSIAYPIGMYVDLFCGLFSIWLVMGDIVDSAAAWQVYVITLVQGAALNLLLMMYMCIVWGVQRIFCRKPMDEGLCPTCGYDLRASRDVCPECGTAIAATTADAAG